MISNTEIKKEYHKLNSLASGHLKDAKLVTRDAIVSQHRSMVEKIGDDLKKDLDQHIFDHVNQIDSTCTKSSMTWKYLISDYQPINKCIGVAESVLDQVLDKYLGA